MSRPPIDNDTPKADPMSSRPVLSARMPKDPASPVELVTVAIRRKICVRATYNRSSIELAPHALYTRHGDWFVTGVVLERDGAPPRELKLGTFKLIGLKETMLAPKRFAPQPVFDPSAELYGEEAVLIDA